MLLHHVELDEDVLLTRSSKTGVTAFSQWLWNLTAVSLEDSIGLLGPLQLWWVVGFWFCLL